MNESAKRAVFKVSIKGTVDAVWRELTRTDGPQRAMFNTVLHTDGVAPGGQLRMRSLNGKYTGVAGQYIEVEKPVRLSHTMRFTSSEDPACKIIYTLQETAEGVDLTLTVDDLPLGTKSEKQLRQGGAFITNNLKAIVETGKPTLGARLLFLLFKALEPLSPRAPARSIGPCPPVRLWISWLRGVWQMSAQTPRTSDEPYDGGDMAAQTGTGEHRESVSATEMHL